MKKINCWLERYGKGKDNYPTIHLKKPLKREILNGKSFGYKYYKAEIILKKEV